MPAILANPLVQMILGWLFNKVWALLSEGARAMWADHEANKVLDEHIKKTLEKYDAVVVWANELAKDGLTELEKDAIRKKKIEVERDLINGIPR